jgi:hypothetical protein
VVTEKYLQDVEAKIRNATVEAGALERTIQRLEYAAVQELKDVRERIVDAKCTLRVIEKQLLALNDRRDCIVHERTALGIPLTVESFRASPIRRVPIDILVAIFLSSKLEEVVPMEDGVGPLLSHVCREWRTIACKISALWASFSFGVLDRQLLVCTWVPLYLERSGAVPLTVAVDATRHSRDLIPALTGNGGMNLLLTKWVDDLTAGTIQVIEEARERVSILMFQFPVPSTKRKETKQRQSLDKVPLAVVHGLGDYDFE